ncbi:asparagine--tRNA ligase, cytoplasmic 2-like [Aristolochia californica]|uniref:asparagine--tRNA ligase, cytoplasmic 2-like n=1 Tax=Aristolochia californica TaxID=171875 RepID=UPI0035DA751A
MANEPATNAVHPEPLLTPFKYSNRVVLRTILGRTDGGSDLDGEKVVIGGWVKSSKEQAKTPSLSDGEDVTCAKMVQTRLPSCLKNVVKLLLGADGGFHRKFEIEKKAPSMAYLQVNDGSCVSNLEVVIDTSLSHTARITAAGTAILVEGVLRKPAQGKRALALHVEKVLHVGTVDFAKYPVAKSRLPLEFLRNYSHLRPRKTMVASITRVRSTLSYATHSFFQNQGFIYVNMPMITSMKASDCSNTFQVTTIFSQMDRSEDLHTTNKREQLGLQVIKAAVKEKSNKVEELKRNDSDKEALAAAIKDLEKANMLASQLEAQEKSKATVTLQDGKVDFSNDFFSCQSYLTATAQLHLESYACALSSVYTFGPTFRAEKFNSNKHLSESWMVEVEMAFAELEDLMNCSEDYMKFLFQWVLENCVEDMKLVSIAMDKTATERLKSMVSSPFERVTYTEAVDTLKKVADKAFETQVEWGIHLTEEHESYLVDEIYKKPTIIYNYPKETRPFYVRLNDDGKTAAAFDVIVPKTGTLVQGSQKEERFDMINKRVQELGLAKDQYEWYVDIRKHGTAKHSGFGLRFDNMVMTVTGVNDVRDVVPFPRTFGRFAC